MDTPPEGSGGTSAGSGGMTPPPGGTTSTSGGSWGPVGGLGGPGGGSSSMGGSSVGGGGAGGVGGNGGMAGAGGSGGTKLIPGTVYLDCIRYQDPQPRIRISYSNNHFYKQDKDGNEILLWPDGTPTGPEGKPLSGQVITEDAKCYTYVTLPDNRYAYSLMPFNNGQQWGTEARDIDFTLSNVVKTVFDFTP